MAPETRLWHVILAYSQEPGCSAGVKVINLVFSFNERSNSYAAFKFISLKSFEACLACLAMEIVARFVSDRVILLRRKKSQNKTNAHNLYLSALNTSISPPYTYFNLKPFTIIYYTHETFNLHFDSSSIEV